MKFDSSSLEIIDTVPVGCNCYGVAMSGNTTVIGTISSVDVFVDGFDATKRKTLLTGLCKTYDVAIDNENNVICSSYTQHIVKKLDLRGNVLFTYRHKELQTPYGLTVDIKGNIFVNGYTSNNIHILSKDGKLLRIVEGVTDPKCIELQNNTNTFFVSNGTGNIKIFEFNEM